MVKFQDSLPGFWKEIADEYESRTVETTVGSILSMLREANSLSPFSEAAAILDIGCGPGTVMSRILLDYDIPYSCELIGCDLGPATIAKVEQKKESICDLSSPWKRIDTFVQNAMDLEDIKDSSVTHVTAGFVRFGQVWSSPLAWLTISSSSKGLLCPSESAEIFR